VRFTTAGLGEFDGESFFTLGWYSRRKSSRRWKYGDRPGARGREFGGEIVPEADDLIAETDKLGGEAVQGGLVGFRVVLIAPLRERRACV